MNEIKHTFPACGPKALGLYPVVDSSMWLERLLPLGVSTIQLRIKNKDISEIEQEIQKSVEIARHYEARLFINDYWQLAIKHAAYGVHLGQEDLDETDLAALQGAGLRLGISTHCLEEINRALTIQPSYLAFGPIYPTNSKPMAFVPQGLKKLQHWCARLDYPIVAIGGINAERLPDVLATGVDGVAMISAITQADDVNATIKVLLEHF